MQIAPFGGKPKQKTSLGCLEFFIGSKTDYGAFTREGYLIFLNWFSHGDVQEYLLRDYINCSINIAAQRIHR
jgi:hypothetical protein